MRTAQVLIIGRQLRLSLGRNSLIAVLQTWLTYVPSLPSIALVPCVCMCVGVSGEGRRV